MKKITLRVVFITAITSLFVAFVLFAFCLINSYSHSGWYKVRDTPVNFIGVVININYSEVIAINFTQASKTLNPLNFTFTNHTISGSENIQYEAIDKIHGFPPSHSLRVLICANLTSRSAYVGVLNDAVVLPESELKVEKEYMIERTNQVAKACNITLDWNNAVWNLSYQD
jgi:hypothetical protein